MTQWTYATRRSALALAQCRAFVSQLERAHEFVSFTELQVVTTGDRIVDRPLSEVGGKGLFVKEIEEALLERRADFAVHSIKDVPGVLPPGLTIACIPLREDPRDALIAPRHGSLAQLPSGARVGTSSLRRVVALRALRPDVVFVPLRGNVDTRLRKVDEGECDAIVLARAGLVRLGLAERITEVLDPSVSLPAVGQGALGIEIREGDHTLRQHLLAVHHVETAVCVAAERGVLLALEGDCRTPIGAFAEVREGHVHLRAFVAQPDGTQHRSVATSTPWSPSEEEAHAWGQAVGQGLLASPP